MCGSKGDMFILNLGKVIPSVIFMLVQYSIYRKKKKISYFYSAFHISRIFVDLFDISTNFKINGSHVCTVFSGLSYKVRFSKALRELFTCSLKPLFFSGL